MILKVIINYMLTTLKINTTPFSLTPVSSWVASPYGYCESGLIVSDVARTLPSLESQPPLTLTPKKHAESTCSWSTPDAFFLLANSPRVTQVETPIASHFRHTTTSAVPAIDANRIRRELIRSPLSSLQPVLRDLAQYPLVTASFFAGAALLAWSEPFPHADKAIMAIGTATALIMIRSGWQASQEALANNCESALEKARLEFGVGTFSLLIVCAVTAGTAAIHASGLLPALAAALGVPEDDSADVIRSTSTLLHFGDEIIWSVMMFQRARDTLAKRASR